MTAIVLCAGIPVCEAAEQTPYDILENVCTASRLEGKKFETNLKVLPEAKGMKIVEVPIDNLRVLVPDAAKGWVLQEGQDQFVVAYGEKAFPKGTSRSCSISVQADELDDWNRTSRRSTTSRRSRTRRRETAD